jgi:hypothetical protein
MSHPNGNFSRWKNGRFMQPLRMRHRFAFHAVLPGGLRGGHFAFDATTVWKFQLQKLAGRMSRGGEPKMRALWLCVDHHRSGLPV